MCVLYLICLHSSNLSPSYNVVIYILYSTLIELCYVILQKDKSAQCIWQMCVIFHLFAMAFLILTYAIAVEKTDIEVKIVQYSEVIQFDTVLTLGSIGHCLKNQVVFTSVNTHLLSCVLLNFCILHMF